MNILLNASFQRLLGTGSALDCLKTDRNIFISWKAREDTESKGMVRIQRTCKAFALLP